VLDAELWRAIRLVTDTGLHAKGWTRKQVLEYMYANSPIERTRAISEAERFMPSRPRPSPTSGAGARIGAATGATGPTPSALGGQQAATPRQVGGRAPRSRNRGLRAA